MDIKPSPQTNIFFRFFSAFRYRLIRSILREKILLFSDSGYLARTFAFGLFLGFSPTFGIQIVLGVASCFLINSATKYKVNSVTVLILTFFTNPFTVVPIYFFYQFLGCQFITCDAFFDFKDMENLKDIWQNFSNLAFAFSLGATIVSLSVGFVGYFIGMYTQKVFVYRLRRKPLSSNH